MKAYRVTVTMTMRVQAPDDRTAQAWVAQNMSMTLAAGSQGPVLNLAAVEETPELLAEEERKARMAALALRQGPRKM